MKAICALIPAALLAGTVLSGPVDARGTTGFGAFASDAISKQDYLIVMNARRLGKPKRAGNLKAPRQVAAARKATKKAPKAVDLKPRRKPATPTVADRKQKTVAASKPDEIKPHKTARLEPESMSKVLRSGPRQMKNVTLSETLPIRSVNKVRITPLELAAMTPVLRSGPREIKEVTSSEALPISGVSEVRIASLEPASMNEVLRSGPREVKNVTLSEALPISGVSEVRIASLEPASINEVLRSGPREVKNVTLGEALPVRGAREARIGPLEPASLSTVRRSGPREVKKFMPGEALQVGAAGEVRITHSGPASMSKVLRSGPREVSVDASEVRIIENIRETAPYYGVPTWFALRIAEVESGYNPYARGRAGEIGIYQLKCQTARVMGFEGDCASLTNARTNVRWGLKHLSLAITMSGGNLKLAASKHNAGLARKSLVNSYVAKVF